MKMILLINNYSNQQPLYYLTESHMFWMGMRFKEICGMDFTVKHFTEVNWNYVIAHPEFKCIITSGTSDDWSSTNFDIYAGEYDIVRNSDIPFLGICAGSHIMALGYGGGNGRVMGGREQRFFNKIEKLKDSPIFEGLGNEIEVWHYYSWEIKELPEEFDIIATNNKAKIQAIQHKTRPLFGLQCHPENFDENHSDGRRILENFFNFVERHHK